MVLKTSLCFDLSDIKYDLCLVILGDTNATPQHLEIVNLVIIRLIEAYFESFNEDYFQDVIYEIASLFAADHQLSEKIKHIHDYLGYVGVKIQSKLREFCMKVDIDRIGKAYCIDKRLNLTIIEIYQ